MAKLLIDECLHTSLLELAHAAGHIASKRPWRDCSRMSSLPRTGVLAYSQPSLRDSVCKSSSHAGSLKPKLLSTYGPTKVVP